MSFLAYLLWQTKVMAGDHVYSAYLARFWRSQRWRPGVSHLQTPVLPCDKAYLSEAIKVIQCEFVITLHLFRL